MKIKIFPVLFIIVLLMFAFSGCKKAESVNTAAAEAKGAAKTSNTSAVSAANPQQDETQEQSVSNANSSLRISHVVTCEKLDQEMKPINPTKNFPPGVSEMNISMVIHDYSKDEIVTAKWTFLETGDMFDSTDFSHNADLEANYIGFTVEKMDGGTYPSGSYKADIYLNGILAETLDFMVADGSSANTVNEQQTASIKGKIVFSSDAAGSEDIYLINPDGSGLTALTDDKASDFAPAWTPDGSQIVFVSDRDGDNELYAMNPDGSDVRKLTDNEANDESPAVSPDNSKIVFSSDLDGNYDLYIMDDKGNVTNLTKNDADNYGARFVTEGKKVIFSSDVSGNYEIYVMYIDGTGNVVNITNNRAFDENPAISPDNKLMAFSANRDDDMEIYIMDDNGKITRLTDNNKDDYMPVWSPDGSKIAFISKMDGDYDIYIMNIDGTGLVNITNNSSNERYLNWGNFN